MKMWSIKHLYNLTRKYPTAAHLSAVLEDQIGFSESWSAVPRILRKIGFGYRKLLIETRNMRK
jgi:transposase